MYYKKIYLLLIAVVAIMSSCSKDFDSFPIYGYEIWIAVDDLQGKDVLENLPYNEHTKTEGNEYHGNIYDVRTDAYKISIIQPENPKEELKVFPLRIIKNEEGNDLLVLQSGPAVFHSPKYHPSVFNFKLTCPVIFGDNEEHTFTTNWDLPNVNSHKCVSVVIDGKTYTDWEDGELGERTFYIILDK